MYALILWQVYFLLEKAAHASHTVTILQAFCALYFSYIHRNISMRFLTCEPNLQHKENYLDEADIFFNDPIGWLKREYASSSKPWPSHLVYFSPLQKRLESYLAQSGYKQCASFFHTHLPEGRVGKHVLVSCR